MSKKALFPTRSAEPITTVKRQYANCCWKHAYGGGLRVSAEELFGDPRISYLACYVADEQNGKELISQFEGMEAHVLARVLAT